jgi:hypothetical protein
MGTPAFMSHHQAHYCRLGTLRKFVPCFVPYQLENRVHMGNMTLDSSRPYVVKMDVVTET